MNLRSFILDELSPVRNEVKLLLEEGIVGTLSPYPHPPTASQGCKKHISNVIFPVIYKTST